MAEIVASRFGVFLISERCEGYGVRVRRPEEHDGRAVCFFWSGRVQIFGVCAGPIASRWMQNVDPAVFNLDVSDYVTTVRSFEDEDELREHLWHPIVEYLTCAFRDAFVLARLGEAGARADAPSGNRAAVRRGAALLFTLLDLGDAGMPTIGLGGAGDLGALAAAWERRVLALGDPCFLPPPRAALQRLPANTCARIDATGELLVALAGRLEAAR